MTYAEQLGYKLAKSAFGPFGQQAPQPQGPTAGQLAKSFLFGVDPTGTFMTQMGREATPQVATALKTVGTIGGAVGGGVLVPSAIMAASKVIPAIMAGAKWRTLPGVALSGAIDLYRNLWRARKATRALSQAKRTGQLTQQQAQAVRTGGGAAPVADVADAARKMQRSGQVDPRLLAGGPLPSGGMKISPEVAEQMRQTIAQNALMGELAIAGTSALGGLSAMKQFGLGQKIREQMGPTRS